MSLDPEEIDVSVYSNVESREMSEELAAKLAGCPQHINIARTPIGSAGRWFTSK